MRDRLFRLWHRPLPERPPAPEEVPHRRTVLVCSGGGLHGAAQAGMLHELARCGLVVDEVVGVSAGALNGVFYAADPTPQQAARLVDVWLGLPKRGVFEGNNAERLWALLAKHDAIYSGKTLRTLVTSCIGDRDLEATALPVHVATCDLDLGATHWWRKGPAIDILCASAAVPGALPPVRLEGRFHVDGGVLSNVPVGKAVELGATRIVCLDVSASPTAGGSHGTALSMFLTSWMVGRAALTAAELAAVPAAVDLHHLRFQPPSNLGMTEFRRAGELAELGRQVVRDYLAQRPDLVAELS